MDSLFGDDPSLGRRTYTVADLGRAVAAALDAGLPSELWVQGEVRNISRSAAGHVYFDLIDPVPSGGSPEASISVVLFKSTRDQVNRLLSQRGAVRIDDGVVLRIRAEIDFYPPQGRLQLRMTGIDPEYTLGQLAADRERLLRLLRDEDLLEANARIPLPPLPLAVGLVTSAGSAAAADFLHELELSGISWRVRLVDTRVQGQDAPVGIARAISGVAASCDAVVVIRGGGARTDLAVFDSEVVARAIAGCARPVLTGIGHEIDRSIADEVAHLALKTPTACAAALVERVRLTAGELDRRWHAIADAARRGMGLRAERLDAAARRAAGATRAGLQSSDAHLVEAARRTGRIAPRLVERAEHEIDARHATAAERARRAADRAAEVADTRAQRIAAVADRSLVAAATHAGNSSRRLRSASRRTLTEHRRRLDTLSARAGALDPARTLARGWSITRRSDGAVLRSVDEVDPGAEIVTTVGDGRIVGQVIATEPDGGAP